MRDDRTSRIAAELEKLRALEAEKRQVHDREIGGPLALRPNEQFIRDNTGPLKSEAELTALAIDRVDKELRGERIDAQNRAEVERSMREHNARVERETKWGDRPLSDETRKAGEQMRERDRQARQISDDFNRVR